MAEHVDELDPYVLKGDDIHVRTRSVRALGSFNRGE
jgi:hypothetical protein